MGNNALKIDCIADTHGAQPILPGGDILVIAGDISYQGEPRELAVFNAWVSKQDYQAKVLIAGNHDWLFERNLPLAKSLVPSVTHYLQDSGTTILGLRFWGSPIQPEFMNWAFNRKRGAEIKRHWDMIPTEIDVLVTHGPPHSILDKTEDGRLVGCEELRTAVERIQPKLHIFGHIHEGYGHLRQGNTLFVNASIMTERYQPVHKPIRVQMRDGHSAIVDASGASTAVR